MLAPDPAQARPSQMCHPTIEGAKHLIGPPRRFGVGVILINAVGEVTIYNHHAAEIVRQADGLSLIKSRLCAAASDEAEVLDRLIATAVADDRHGASGVAIVHRPSLRQPFVLIIRGSQQPPQRVMTRRNRARWCWSKTLATPTTPMPNC
jgi:hypothetical protein